jgi:hypothetical protein
MRPADAATKTVRLYGEELQRGYGGFVRRSKARARPVPQIPLAFVDRAGAIVLTGRCT